MTKGELKQYVLDRAKKNYGGSIEQNVFVDQMVDDAIRVCRTAIEHLPDLVAARIIRTLVQYQQKIDEILAQQDMPQRSLMGEVIGPEEFLIDFGDSILDLEARSLAAGLEESTGRKVSQHMGKLKSLIGISV